MTVQSISSVARQILALISIAMGVVTASVTSLHLPTAVSGLLVTIGGVVIAIEHYVADPSTGTPVPAKPLTHAPVPPPPPVPPVVTPPVVTPPVT